MTGSLQDIRVTTFFLWLFTCLLVLRVVGQLFITLRAYHQLPSMAQWQWGLLAYPVLLAGRRWCMTIIVWISMNVLARLGVLMDRLRIGGY